uniref:28 kDa Metastriate family member n=1 Tax=Rhipicephalus zambeziensis TaxID=60191 RepID=A0A224Y388_9ACAR
MLYSLQKAQKKFRDHNITVTFVVQSVQNRSDYLVKIGNKSINASETLNKMIEIAKKEQAPNNSIRYHFSGYRIMVNETRVSEYGVAGVATNGTFCTEPSAAILLYLPESNNTNSFVSVTAKMFGAKMSPYFDQGDIRAMNKTLQKCETKSRRKRAPGKAKKGGKGGNKKKGQKNKEKARQSK